MSRKINGIIIGISYENYGLKVTTKNPLALRLNAFIHSNLLTESDLQL